VRDPPLDLQAAQLAKPRFPQFDGSKAIPADVPARPVDRPSAPGAMAREDQIQDCGGGFAGVGKESCDGHCKLLANRPCPSALATKGTKFTESIHFAPFVNYVASGGISYTCICQSKAKSYTSRQTISESPIGGISRPDRGTAALDACFKGCLSAAAEEERG
jgi:hypothetical protein